MVESRLYGHPGQVSHGPSELQDLDVVLVREETFDTGKTDD
jgi:hypothetical protein